MDCRYQSPMHYHGIRLLVMDSLLLDVSAYETSSAWIMQQAPIAVKPFAFIGKCLKSSWACHSNLGYTPAIPVTRPLVAILIICIPRPISRIT